MKLSRFATGFVAVALVAFVVSDAFGQDQQRRGGGGRGGAPGGFQGRGPGGGGPGGPGGADMTLGLLRIEAVQTELEVSPKQKEALEKMASQAMEQAREAFAGGERPDFRNMSEADRNAFFEKMRKQVEERTAEMKAQLDEVLLPQQIERLNQIGLQVRGVQALEDDEVAKNLNITAAQKAKFAQIREAQGAKMREMFQAGGGPGAIDREAFGKLREETEKEVLAVLESGQQAKFEEMKGEAFEMPEGALGRGGFGGGPGGPGGRGGPGGGPGGRPGRGGRPPAE